MPRIFYKMKEAKLRILFDQVDLKLKGEIGFDQFFDLMKKIMWEEQVEFHV